MDTATPPARTLVVGSPGAGKSTFARAMRDACGLPLIYLDMIWHTPDKANVTCEQFDRRLTRELARDRWIIDGNYLHTLERRLERTDTVFLFDLPVDICLAGAAARIGQPREDLPWVEHELDPEFADYIRRFPTEQRPQLMDLLAARPSACRLVTFRTHAEADAYLARLRAGDDERTRTAQGAFIPGGRRGGHVDDSVRVNGDSYCSVSMARMLGIAQVAAASSTMATPVPANHRGAPTASANRLDAARPTGMAQDMIAP